VHSLQQVHAHHLHRYPLRPGHLAQNLTPLHPHQQRLGGGNWLFGVRCIHYRLPGRLPTSFTAVNKGGRGLSGRPPLSLGLREIHT
jgi:hypothetical protein